MVIQTKRGFFFRVCEKGSKHRRTYVYGMWPSIVDDRSLVAKIPFYFGVQEWTRKTITNEFVIKE